MMNDDLRSESFVEPRRFECYNLASREKGTANLKHFRRGSWVRYEINQIVFGDFLPL